MLSFAAPLGIVGAIAELVELKRYLTRFLIERNEVIRTVAESDAWKAYMLVKTC